MTNPVLHTSHHRADCKLIPHESCDRGWWHDGTDYLNTLPATNYIEEQWDGSRLVRFRTIRLGADEVCEFCNGNDAKLVPCKVCGMRGVKPRDLNPPWTEVETELSLDEAKTIINSQRLDAENICEFHRREMERAEQWKAIATQLVHSGSHKPDCHIWFAEGCDCGWNNAEMAWESALAQEGK